MLTWVEIKKSAIKNNLRQFRKIVSRRTQVMAVVKSNAYGHDMVETAKLALQAGADWLGVISLDEALRLRQARITAPIFILSYWEIGNILKIGEELVSIRDFCDIHFPVYTFAQAQALSQLGRQIKREIPVHLKIDTGTSRIGVLPTEAVKLAQKIKKLPYLNLCGVFTHYAASENKNQVFTNQQTKLFTETINRLEQNGIHITIKHAACSAATIVNQSTHFNLIRVGIALYGLWPSTDVKHFLGNKKNSLRLQPALSWKTKIIQIKELPRGTYVGYDRTYKLHKKNKIAVLPIGYWDGYARHFSGPSPLKNMGGGEVLIGGRRCPVRGRVCMNLTMVELPSQSIAKVGDEVVLIGKQGQEEITVDELAKKIGTINYEIVTRINPLLPRVYK